MNKKERLKRERKVINDFKKRLSEKIYKGMDGLDKEREEEGGSEEIDIEYEMLEVFLEVIKRTR